MALVDQHAAVGMRDNIVSGDFQLIWSGPAVSGFLINVSDLGHNIAIKCTPPNSYVLRPGDSLGVKNVTLIQAVPASTPAKIAYALFYAAGASLVQAEGAETG